MIELRDLKPKDRRAAIQLWQDCDLTVPWNDPGADYDRALENPSSRILGGFKNGALVSTAMVGYEGHRGWIYYVCVSPSERRAGIAKQMMHAAESWLKSLGAPKVMLMVREGNSRAQSLYEALGYDVSPVTTYGKFFD